MSDTYVRHFVAFMATLVCLAAYYSGYFSGKNGWWWTAFGLLIVYSIVYKMIHSH